LLGRWKRAEAERLFDVSQRLVEAHNVGPEILAVCALVLVRAVRLKLVVSAISVVEVDELDLIDAGGEHVSPAISTGGTVIINATATGVATPAVFTETGQ